MKKFISVLLTILILTGVFATALPVTVSASPIIERRADPSTLDGWKAFFGESIPNTGFSGTVWSDKTVLTDPSVLGNSITLSEPDNFSVVLSALACDVSVKGYSTEPSDTVIVVDSSSANEELDEVIAALNDAVVSIQNINKHNRVGVVSYSGNYDMSSPSQLSDSKVLLPIGRYSHSSNQFFVKKSAKAPKAEMLCVNSGVFKANGEQMQCVSTTVFGASYVQSGIYTAMNEFLCVEDTVIGNSEMQSGSKRLPVMILVSSGAPNVGSYDYANVGTSNMGDGSSPANELESAIPFVTQLTASYAKERITEHYDNTAVIYTLSLDKGDHPVVAPSTSSTNINKHWNTYNLTAPDATMQLGIGRTWISDETGGHWQTNHVSIQKNSYELKKNYVNDYFRADISVDAAFSRVVNELNTKSQHYPTYVEGENDELGGYIEFIDDIGQYMEVKKINGIKLGGVLYTGEAIAKNFRPGGGELGSIDSPNDLGNELIGSVMARLGISDLVRAQDLITRAYRAKQLYYDSTTGEYSNYIGWYADAEGNFICHGAEGDKILPENAVFYNRSYGFTGVVADGYKATDTMYVSVQVHTRIATGTSAVIFRVPAALIPVITYNVTMSGDSMEDPGAIFLSYDDDMEIDTDGDGLYDSSLPMGPIRLVYEVGLKSDIDEITVQDKVSENYKYVKDGKYTFYTNRWNPDDMDHVNPSVAENTVAFFSPSEDNERYYYTENTPVYLKSGDEYILYKGSAPAYENGKYYRPFKVFEYNNDVTEGNAIVHIHYEEISQKSLEKAKVEKDGSWYIPKGTIHRFYEEYSHQKSENVTGTLEYAHYPRVERIEETDDYYVDFILGNNGCVSIEAASGIKITQQGDDTMVGYNGIYSYLVSGKDGSYRLVISDNNGKRTTSELKISKGEGLVNLKEGETAYIIDLPADEIYSIKELTEGFDYQVKSVNSQNSDSIDIKISDRNITDVNFVNTLIAPVGSGSVILRCMIDHPFDSNVNSEGVDFEFKVDFYNGDVVFRTENLTLKDVENRRFDDIPLGTKVVIEQTLVPFGFTTDKEEKRIEIMVDEERIYTTSFVNTYSPNPVENINVTVTGTMSFTGRTDDAWLESDEFTFMLQKRVGTKWVDMGTDTVSSPDEKLDFSKLIQNEVYDSAGAYSYRIFEVYSDNPLNGITYDKSIAWFDVIVTDENWDGEYEIDNVVGFNGIIVGKAGSRFNAHASFTSRYGVAGTDSVSILVNAEVEDFSGSTAPKTPSGLSFGLYQSGELVQTLPVTSAAGESVITLNFGSLNVGKNIEYTLKQIVPDEPEKAMQYSDKEYPITVTLYDDTMGGVYALISSEGRKGQELSFDFVNVYDPADYLWTPGANVILEGDDITDGRFEFVICKADSSFTELTELQKVENAGNSVTFDTITMDKAGRYFYVIMQIDQGEEGMTYDKAAYEIIVDVEDVDGSFAGKVTAEKELEFVNTYKKPEGSDVTKPGGNQNSTTKPGQNKPSTSPQTEDKANFALWYGMLIISGLSMALLTLTSNKLRSKFRR